MDTQRAYRRILASRKRINIWPTLAQAIEIYAAHEFTKVSINGAMA
jgi:ribosomal protein S19